MPKRVHVVAAILPLMAVLGGCRYEATIDAKGGAQIKLHYRADPKMTLEEAVAALQSPDVKLVSKSLDKDHYVDATLQTADLTKLSTTAYFKSTTITLVDGPAKGTSHLRVHYVNASPMDKPAANALEYSGKQLEVALTLPGSVLTSNATETKGSTATWLIESAKFLAAKETDFDVTYRVGK